MRPCVIGVDLGGTNVRACAYFEDGTPAGERVSNPSRAQEGTTAIIDAIAATIEAAAKSAPARPSAVGMAMPGHIDGKNGIVVWAPNFGETRDGVFYNWENMPVGEPLEKRIGMPVHCGNDANLAAFGEYKFGS